jgi:hypothetical protein
MEMGWFDHWYSFSKAWVTLQCCPAIVSETAASYGELKPIAETISRWFTVWATAPHLETVCSETLLDLYWTSRRYKGKLVPGFAKHYAMKAYWCVDVQSHVLSTSTLVGSEWLASRSDCFTQGEVAPGTHWLGGWMGPRGGLDDIEKWTFFTLPGLELPVSTLSRNILESGTLDRHCCENLKSGSVGTGHSFSSFVRRRGAT